MRAIVCHGPKDVRVDNKPMPKIEDAEDVIIKVTTMAICGSDLQLLHLIEKKRIDPTPKSDHAYLDWRRL